jgi:hypothetical protein
MPKQWPCIESAGTTKTQGVGVYNDPCAKTVYVSIAGIVGPKIRPGECVVMTGPPFLINPMVAALLEAKMEVIVPPGVEREA